MDFLKLIQSLDELLYEIMSWLLFYPATLWRVLRSPLGSMLDVERELAENEDLQFNHMLAPPLFLLLTLILVHAVELSVVGQSDLVKSNVGLSRLISNDTNLILLRVVTFALLPLVAARRLIKAQGAELDKRLIKPPFYAQCYNAGMFALLFGVASLFVTKQAWGGAETYFLLVAVGLAWLIVIETRWFAAELKCSILAGFGQALWMTGQWLLVLLAVGMMLS